MDTILLTGLFAAFFTTFAFAPQSIKTIRTRNTEGISVCYVYHVPDRCNLMDSVWHYAI